MPRRDGPRIEEAPPALSCAIAGLVVAAHDDPRRARQQPARRRERNRPARRPSRSPTGFPRSRRCRAGTRSRGSDSRRRGSRDRVRWRRPHWRCARRAKRRDRRRTERRCRSTRCGIPCRPARRCGAARVLGSGSGLAVDHGAARIRRQRRLAGHHLEHRRLRRRQVAARSAARGSSLRHAHGHRPCNAVDLDRRTLPGCRNDARDRRRLGAEQTYR